MDKLPAILIITVLGISVSSYFMSNVNAPPNSIPSRIRINGADRLASSRLDICGNLNLGHCPLVYTLSQKYDQQVTLTPVIASFPLQSGETGTIGLMLTPEQPRIIFNVNFKIGSNSFNYTYTPQPPESPGAVVVDNLPLTSYIEELSGMGVLPSSLNNGVSLNVPYVLGSTLTAKLSGSDFTVSAQELTWDHPTTLYYNAKLIGSKEDSTLIVDQLASVYRFEARIVLNTLATGNADLYDFTKLSEFKSSGPTIISHWYHLNILSKYHQSTGSGWYPSGSTATFTLPSSTFTQSGQTHMFQGWIGTGSGSYTGTSRTHDVILTGPITETAIWTSNTGNGQAAEYSPPPSNMILASALIFAGIISAITLTVRARTRKSA